MIFKLLSLLNGFASFANKVVPRKRKVVLSVGAVLVLTIAYAICMLTSSEDQQKGCFDILNMRSEASSTVEPSPHGQVEVRSGT